MTIKIHNHVQCLSCSSSQDWSLVLITWSGMIHLSYYLRFTKQRKGYLQGVSLSTLVLNCWWHHTREASWLKFKALPWYSLNLQKRWFLEPFFIDSPQITGDLASFPQHPTGCPECLSCVQLCFQPWFHWFWYLLNEGSVNLQVLSIFLFFSSFENAFFSCNVFWKHLPLLPPYLLTSCSLFLKS